METQMAAAPLLQKPGSLRRALAKLLRRWRPPAGAAASVAGDESLDNSINSLSKLKLSGSLAAFFKKAAVKKTASAAEVAAAHELVANLFAGVSAVKAAYAQLQLGQWPYDGEAIQSADSAVVAELTKLSDLKRRHLRDSAAAAEAGPTGTALAAQAEEQRHLRRTYEITVRKLESEVRCRDTEAERARGELATEHRAAHALEARLHPGRTLSALNDLHLSGLNATHFLTALHHAAKSIRSFANSMLCLMRPAGWDVAAAAAAVHPGITLHRTEDTKFALESYVALKMFTNFHRKNFNLSFLDDRSFYDSRRFFEEFTELKASPANAFLDARSTRWSALGKFLRSRYMSLVHPRMETALFGRLEQRGVVSAGHGFPETAWFAEFAEMARSVWLLHCLFFAFDGGASVFQARPGARFSEVYMESVNDGDGEDAGTMASAAGGRVVGFTVVPGFRVGRTVMQCRVYLSRGGSQP